MNNEEKKVLKDLLSKIFGAEVVITDDVEEEPVVTETQEEAQKIAMAVLRQAGYKDIIIAACNGETHCVTTPKDPQATLHLLESIKDHAEEKMAFEAFIEAVKGDEEQCD